MRRRTYLAVLGAGTVVSLAGCSGGDEVGDGDADQATDTEEDGETIIEVTTGNPTDVGPAVATLTGEVSELTGYDEVAVGFEYGQSGGALDTTADAATIEEAESFDAEITDLQVETDYEFRAVAEDGDDSATGEAATFTTEPADHTVRVDDVEFEPAELELDPGETVEWVWVGSSGHNIVVRDIPADSSWDGTEGADTYTEGHTHQHTFQEEGLYTYFCAPHIQWGMEGSLVVGDVDESEQDHRTIREGDVTITAGPGGDDTFSPQDVTVETGTTVRWEFESVGHNVKPDEIPDESDWTGTEGGDFDTLPAGETHEHTFEIPGTYEYYCGPHRQFGMQGTVEVVDR